MAHNEEFSMYHTNHIEKEEKTSTITALQPLQLQTVHSNFSDDTLLDMFPTQNYDDNKNMIYKDVPWSPDHLHHDTQDTAEDFSNINVSESLDVQCEEIQSSFISDESTTRQHFLVQGPHRIPIVMLQQYDSYCNWSVADNTVISLPSPNTETTNLSDYDLPTKTKSDFDVLEMNIKRNPVLRTELKSQLTKIGGKNSSDCVRALLKALMTDEVRKEFNWKGRYNKKGIENYALVQLIFEAVQDTSNYPNEKIKVLQEVVRVWLKNVQSTKNSPNKKRKSH